VPVMWCARMKRWLGPRTGGCGPGSWTGRWNSANPHFRVGEGSRTLPSTARAPALLPDYDAIVFSSYQRMGIRVEEVLKQGLTGEKRAAQAFFRQVLGWPASMPGLPAGFTEGLRETRGVPVRGPGPGFRNHHGSGSWT